jgi:hypothetical protein
MLVGAIRWLGGLESRSRKLLIAAALFPWIVVMILPAGGLSHNEEHYFAMAAHQVNEELPAPGSSVMRGMPHTAVFGTIIGTLVERFGYEATQSITRMIVAILFAVALARLFAVLKIGVWDSLLVVLTFFLLGQSSVGQESLIFDAEPKALAYPLVLFALADYLSGRLLRSVLWLIPATYFHVLVGGMWAALMFAAFVFDRRSLREALVPGLLYAAAVAPLVVRIVIAEKADAASAAGMPSVGEIFALYRMPHHVYPFANRAILRAWLPGVSATLALAVLVMLGWLVARREHRPVLSLLCVSYVWLIAALVITYLDPTYTLATITPFRISGITLLLTITLGVALLYEVPERERIVIKFAALLVLAAMSVPSIFYYSVEPSQRTKAQVRSSTPLIDFVQKHTAANATFLIDPQVEDKMLWFERQTHRRVLITRKFIPAATADVHEWYRRLLYQMELLRIGCSAKGKYTVDYLIMAQSDSSPVRSTCGPVVFSGNGVALIEAVRNP